MAEIYLTLVMIVKNESKIMERCLNSVRSIIHSVVISDTGSTDTTVDIIDGWMKDNAIPGKVYHDEWKHFGHNRSKSVTNAQEWLAEQGRDLTKHYLLTIDADMIFCITSEFTTKKLMSQDSWLLRQINPSMTYYNKRIFRASLPYKCIGVTHEYWGCDAQETHGKMDELFINDIGDGGAKADKFERDIRLLSQGVIDEPKNERYYFYLAQSYSDAGQKEEGITWYKKRIEAGGWFEEVFMAHLRIGDIYDGLGQAENALYWWGLGYDYCPSRSETLFRMIHKYRMTSKNQLALMLLRTALQIDYPKDQVLFIEHNIYEYRLYEELSISGFYTPKRTISFMAGEYLFLGNNIPEQVKHQSLQNAFFYMAKLACKTHRTFAIEVDEPYKTSSSSLFKTKIGYTGCVRAVNYSIDKQFKYHIRDPNGHVKTKNYWVTMDNSGNVMKKYEIVMSDTCPKPRETHICGLEDLRVVKMGDGYLGLGISFEYGAHNHPSISLCVFKRDEKTSRQMIDALYPIRYRDHETQKNWAPFVQDGKLRAIYSYKPLVILEINPSNGDTSVVLQRDPHLDLSQMRGSAIPMQLADGSWLVLVHQVMHRDTRKYFHRFLLYSNDWELREVSIPFYFQNLFVEFTLSMALEGNTLSIFYSTEDNTTEMMTTMINEIVWIPKDFPKYCKATL